MFGKRRQRSNHKPRGVDPAEYAADLALRAAVHNVIRVWYPDAPAPSGTGWLVTAAPVACLKCQTGDLRLVKVPGFEPTFCYCRTCSAAGEFSDSEAE